MILVSCMNMLLVYIAKHVDDYYWCYVMWLGTDYDPLFGLLDLVRLWGLLVHWTCRLDGVLWVGVFYMF